MKKVKLLLALLAFFIIVPAGIAIAKNATVINLDTGHRKAVEVGDPNAFKGGYTLETSYGYKENDGEMLGFSVISDYYVYLSQSMSATQDTIPVTSMTTQDDHTIVMGDLGSKVFLTIDPDDDDYKEIVMCTGISGTSWTGCNRGLAFYSTSTASVTANKKTHNSGAIVIMSNVGQVFEEFMDKDTAETIGGVKTFSSYPQIETYVAPTANEEFVPKKYADDLTAQGVATTTEDVFGGSYLGTRTEMASSTWDANMPTVLQTKYSSDNTRGFDLMENQATGGSDQTATTTTTYLAQTFKTTATTTRITRLSLNLKKIATPTGTTTIALYSTASNVPNASLGTMGTVSSSTMTVGYVSYDFDDLNINVSPNKTYAIVLSATGVDDTNYVNWEYSNSSVYSDGNYTISYNSGTDWTASTTADFVFKVYGNEPATSNTAIISDDDGKLDQSWLDLSEDFSFSGNISVPATNSGGGFMPIGSLTAYATTTAPSGWLACDGSEISSTTYASLFTVIGYTYGGNAGGDFKLPNLNGRNIVGYGSATTTFDTMGEIGGEDEHLLTGAESGTSAHSHPIAVHLSVGSGYGGVASAGSTPDNTKNTNNSTEANASTAHNVMDPFIVLRYIIKY